MVPTELLPDEDATQVGRNGWRQGSVASGDFLERLEGLGLRSPVAGRVAIVLSHDCDVVNSSFNKEPLVELVWASPVGQPDGSVARGKNPRCLQFSVQHQANGDVWFEARACDRFTIPRSELLHQKPSQDWSLAAATKRQVATWVARRYDRSAFPDEFNNRLRRLPNKKLHRALEAGGAWIDSLHAAIIDKELDEDQHYELVLRAVMTVEDFEDPGKREQAEHCLLELVGLLNSADGIEVREAELVSEAEVSLDDLRWMKRWTDLDWLSVPEPVD